MYIVYMGIKYDMITNAFHRSIECACGFFEKEDSSKLGLQNLADLGLEPLPQWGLPGFGEVAGELSGRKWEKPKT